MENEVFIDEMLIEFNNGDDEDGFKQWLKMCREKIEALSEDKTPKEASKAYQNSNQKSRGQINGC